MKLSSSPQWYSDEFGRAETYSCGVFGKADARKCWSWLGNNNNLVSYQTYVEIPVASNREGVDQFLPDVMLPLFRCVFRYRLPRFGSRQRWLKGSIVLGFAK